jgi:hypothetical protein
MSSIRMVLVILNLVSLIPACLAEDWGTLQPLMVIPNKSVLQETFSKSGPVKKTNWQNRQGTRWSVEDGVLRGRPSSEEYQSSRTHHFGYEPRVSVPVTPTEFLAGFSFRFIGGEETDIVPFIEFGHHVCRVKFSSKGTFIVIDHETLKVAEASDFLYEPGKWYHALAELKGDEFVIQFVDGPVWYVKHECLAKVNASGGNGLGLAGPKNGKVELDNVSIWKIRSQSKPSWNKRRKLIDVMDPVPTGKKKKK